MQIEEYLKDKKHYSYEGVHNTKDFHFVRFEIFDPGNVYHEHIIFDKNLEITYIADKEITWMEADYSTNFFKIEKNNLFGIIDAYGNEIIPINYKKIVLDTEGDKEPDENSLILLKTKNNKEKLSTKTGKKISKTYDYIEDCDFDGMFIVRNKNLCGVINKSGKEIIKLKYDRLRFAYKKDEPIKYIYSYEKCIYPSVLNLKGEVVLPQTYKYINYLGNDKFFCETLEHEFVVETVG